jgi:hypothetical protein
MQSRGWGLVASRNFEREEGKYSHVVSLLHLLHRGRKVTIDETKRRVKQVEPHAHPSLVAHETTDACGNVVRVLVSHVGKEVWLDVNE